MHPSSTSEWPKETTLYPKISGKLPDLLCAITHHAHSHPETFDTAKSIPFTGTVKLHGTHADILVHPHGKVVYQSRNRTSLTTESDNLGFANFCSTRENGIRSLAAGVKRRWQQQRDFGEGVGDDGPIILAGEWIGSGVQKGVAIASLSQKQFVICSIQVHGTWEPIEIYADIANPDAGIHNISLGGFFHLDFSVEDSGEAFLAAARELTAQVTTSCPFGRALGVEGKGEGIVWTPSATSSLPNIPDFWLKTKGEEFVLNTLAPRKSGLVLDQDLKIRSATFAAATCIEARLEQGVEYLREMGMKQSRQTTGAFLSWVVRDIVLEEKRDIEEMKLGKGWKGEVSRVAKAWFEERIREREVLEGAG